MILRNFYLFILLSPLCTQGFAAEYQDITELEKQITAFIYTELRKNGDNEPDVNLNSIDPRLQLASCDKPLTHELQSYGNSGGHLTVQTRCLTSTTRWSIYTPARVKLISQVATLTRNLPRGHQITADDIVMADQDTSMLSAGFITDINLIEGMELKRSLREGVALRHAQLVMPKAVKRGDNVVVEARSGSFSVVTAAEALSNGRVGEQIRVRNNRSERVIKAKVVGPGRVEVLL